MKKIILSVFVFIIVGFLIYSFYGAVQDEKIITAENETIATDIDYLKGYIEDNYAGAYPVPEGDLILLNKKNEQIHLEDRNVSLDKIEGLYIIQGDICDLAIDDVVFQEKSIHDKFSPKANNEYKIKTCYKYAVTKDRKKYQIGYLEKNLNSDYVTKLVGNNSNSMIRAYDSPNMVERDSNRFLPYYPGATKGPMVFIKDLGNESSLSAEVNGKNIDLIVGEKGNLLINEDTQLPANISINGKIGDDDNVQLVYTDGSLIYIQPNKNGIVDFRLDEYSPYENDVKMSLVAGKFLLNMVKFDTKKNVEVNNGHGTTMAIRGTLFIVDTNEETMTTLLGLGKLKLFVGDKEQDIDIFGSFVNIDILKNKITSDLSLLSELAQFMVMTDMSVYNPRLNKEYRIASVIPSIPTEDIIISENQVFVRSKILDVNYNNGKKIQLHVFSGDMTDMAYSNTNYSPIEVKDIMIRYCDKLGKEGVELNDLHYLLDVEKTNTDTFLILKAEIAKELTSSIENLKFFTINKTHSAQYSTRLTYKTKNKKVDSGNFVDLNDIPVSVFMCKE